MPEAAIGAQSQPSGPAPEERDPSLAMPPRKARIAIDRRPGPVVRTVLAAGAHDGDTDAQDTSTGGSALPAGALPGLLAEVDPIFDAIRRARAFRFVDDGFAQTWQQLSSQADQLHKQINSLAA